MLLAIGRLTEHQRERGLATFNLPKLICVVNNIQEIGFAVLDKSCKNAACATVLFLEIGLKSLCATVVLLQIGDFL